MIYELIYTSAREGLKKGSHGFCTVACTDGAPKQIVDRLEALSGYRRLYDLHDRQHANNPVAWSHLETKIGGKSYQVLSRVSDAGLDYSNRGNKLAYHLAITEEELPAAGPAWLLSQPDVVVESWEREDPCTLDLLTELPEQDPASSVGCGAWETITGDAGWAGVLAETLISPELRQVFVVFEPGYPTLDLIAEALVLLPPEERWKQTFTTYFTTLPPGVECKCRFVAIGSTEADALATNENALILDLTAPMGQAPDSPMVQRARDFNWLEESETNTVSRRTFVVPFSHDSESVLDDMHHELEAGDTDILETGERDFDTLENIPPLTPPTPLEPKSGGEPPSQPIDETLVDQTYDRDSDTSEPAAEPPRESDVRETAKAPIEETMVDQTYDRSEEVDPAAAAEATESTVDPEHNHADARNRSSTQVDVALQALLHEGDELDEEGEFSSLPEAPAAAPLPPAPSTEPSPDHAPNQEQKTAEQPKPFAESALPAAESSRNTRAPAAGSKSTSLLAPILIAIAVLAILGGVAGVFFLR